MKLFVYNKKDKIFLIGILVIIVLLIITSIISSVVFKDKEISMASSITESASEDNRISESAVYTDETTDTTTTVSSIGFDTSVTETTVASTDKSLEKDLSVKEIQKLIESLNWTGYTRPDHTDEDKYTLKVSGDTWTVKVSGQDTVKYQIKLNSATLPVGIWTTYHIPCTITYNDKTLDSEFTLMESDGKLILSCDALVCNGFKSTWE